MRLSLLIASLFFLTASPSFALNCQNVKKLTSVMVDKHFFYEKFDNKLSKRMLKNIIKGWDSNKLFFLKSDVDSLKRKFSVKMDDFVKKNDCSAIEEVFKTYSQRFEEIQPVIDKWITTKHNFKVDENVELDADKVPFAKSKKELEERWRKRIKLQILQGLKITNLKEVTSNLQKSFKLARKRHVKLDYDSILGDALNAFATSLDPHTEYYTPDKLERFRIETRLSLEGIGATLRNEYGYTIVAGLVPGGAAAKSGQLKVKDKIIAVAQGSKKPVNVIDMDLNDVVKLIKGQRNTEVRLTVLRNPTDKKPVVISIIREKINLVDKQAKAEVIDVTSKPAKTSKEKTKEYRVAVINIPSFYLDFQARVQNKPDYRSLTKDVKNLLGHLKKDRVDAIVLDVRSNGGGSLEESVTLTGLFIKEGVVVMRKNEGAYPYPHEDKDPRVHYDGPMVVMIDRQSASASEIFAGAIKDYRRGIVVGNTKTYGKGTVQNLEDLSASLGALKVTTSKFYRPSGVSTQLRGVESDIVIPSILDQFDIGEEFTDYPLPWQKIAAAKNLRKEMANLTLPYIRSLKTRSMSRVKVDEDFKKIDEAIKEFIEKKSKRTLVSLKDKSKAEKKDKDDEEESDDEFSFADNQIDIVKDIALQEAVRIATDYARLIKGDKKLDDTYEFPKVLKAKAKELALEKKSTKKIVKNNVKNKKDASAQK